MGLLAKPIKSPRRIKNRCLLLNLSVLYETVQRLHSVDPNNILTINKQVTILSK